MIVYNRDIDSSTLTFGDFTGDGYGDIIGIDTDGNFILVDNDGRHFSRPGITLDR